MSRFIFIFGILEAELWPGQLMCCIGFSIDFRFLIFLLFCLFSSFPTSLPINLLV